MKLMPQQHTLLDGERGEVMAKVVQTLVMYGDTFNSERTIPVTSEYGHTLNSFGLGLVKPVYELYQQLIRGACFQAEIHGRPAPDGHGDSYKPR